MPVRGVGIAVPHHVCVAAKLPVALVQAARLLPEAIDILVVAEALPCPEGGSSVCGPIGRVIGVERGSISGKHFQLKWILLHDDAQRVGLER